MCVPSILLKDDMRDEGKIFCIVSNLTPLFHLWDYIFQRKMDWWEKVSLLVTQNTF